MILCTKCHSNYFYLLRFVALWIEWHMWDFVGGIEVRFLLKCYICLKGILSRNKVNFFAVTILHSRLKKCHLTIWHTNYLYILERIPKIRFSGIQNQPKNGLKACWTRLFFIFCQIFGIFDDFSKWSMPKTL